MNRSIKNGHSGRAVSRVFSLLDRGDNSRVAVGIEAPLNQKSDRLLCCGCGQVEASYEESWFTPEGTLDSCFPDDIDPRNPKLNF
jgi:hypothetical protein